MDRTEIQQTPVWTLYEKGRNYHRLTGIYTDTDRNFRFYNGDQWAGVQLGDGIEPIAHNFIKPIVKYKVAVIHDNLYAASYSSQSYDDPIFARQSERWCRLLCGYTARLWELDKMDDLGRRVTKDAAINGEGIVYVTYDREKGRPVHERLDASDIYYGNENDDDIQRQPYILIRRRMAVANAIDLALSEGVSEELLEYIIGDSDNSEEAGDAAKQELDDKVTVIYKMYKKDGTVHFSIATRLLTIVEDNDTGLSLYPVAHFNWEESKGSSRGQGEVKPLIPNQIEVNRTTMRRVLTAKTHSYPHKVVDKSKITNPQQLDAVGGTLYAKGNTVDDVRKIVNVIPPAQMSPDVKLLIDDLINISRELAGAGDIATGQINPEDASGKAILAVQKASQQPVNEQKEGYKSWIEDVSKIELEYLIVYAEDGINAPEPYTDPMTGEESVRMVNVPQRVLRRLQASVKIDVTPRGTFDKFAQEQTIETLFIQGLLSPEKVGELEIYAKLLDDDSVAPKQKILEGVSLIKEEQRRIASIEARMQEVSQRAQQFLQGDPELQKRQLMAARQRLGQARTAAGNKSVKSSQATRIV